MAENISQMMDMLTLFLSEHVPAKKQEKLGEWMDNLCYVLQHIDEHEFGTRLMYNLLVYCDAVDGSHWEIGNHVVENTELALCVQLDDLLGRRRSRLLDVLQINLRETLLPVGKWLWRSRHSYAYDKKDGSIAIWIVAKKKQLDMDVDETMDRVRDAIGL